MEAWIQLGYKVWSDLLIDQVIQEAQIQAEAEWEELRYKYEELGR